MTFLLSLLTSRLAGPIASGVAVLLALALGWQTFQLNGVRGDLREARAARDAWRTAAQQWIAYGKAEKAAFDASERLRAAETAQSRVALSDAALACNARVARARASGMAISAIINKEPARDPNGCPVRALADPGVLRNALAPRATDR